MLALGLDEVGALAVDLRGRLPAAPWQGACTRRAEMSMACSIRRWSRQFRRPWRWVISARSRSASAASPIGERLRCAGAAILGVRHGLAFALSSRSPQSQQGFEPEAKGFHAWRRAARC